MAVAKSKSAVARSPANRAAAMRSAVARTPLVKLSIVRSPASLQKKRGLSDMAIISIRRNLPDFVITELLSVLPKADRERLAKGRS